MIGIEPITLWSTLLSQRTAHYTLESPSRSPGELQSLCINKFTCLTLCKILHPANPRPRRDTVSWLNG